MKFKYVDKKINGNLKIHNIYIFKINGQTSLYQLLYKKNFYISFFELAYKKNFELIWVKNICFQDFKVLNNFF